MIFRQLFDSVSGTYSYLLASRASGEALILDPVLEKVDRYCQLLRELDLKLVKAVDTHLHADHVTGLGELRDRYAGLPAADIATAKAYTALSFRRSTAELAKMVRDGQMDAGLARMPRIAMLAGGLVIETGGTLVGGIGVSGAPGGDKDEECAKAGLDAVRDKIDF